jgi:hypothetical protein
VLNGFAGGYCRASARGDVADFAEEGPYRLVMEAIEACAALLRLGVDEEDGAHTNAMSKSGQPYFSVRPQR